MRQKMFKFHNLETSKEDKQEKKYPSKSNAPQARRNRDTGSSSVLHDKKILEISSTKK